MSQALAHSRSAATASTPTRSPLALQCPSRAAPSSLGFHRASSLPLLVYHSPPRASPACMPRSALPIASDILQEILDLIDDAVPTAAPATPEMARQLYYEHSRNHNTASVLPQRDATALSDRAFCATEPVAGERPDQGMRTAAPQLNAQTEAEEGLLAWMRALHVLTLACRERLRLDGSAELLRGGTGPVAAPASVAIDGSSSGQADGGADGEVDGDKSLEVEALEVQIAADGDEEEALETYFGKLLAELQPETGEPVPAAAATNAAGTKTADEAEDEAEAEPEDPEAAVRAAEDAENAANTPPPAGQLALSVLKKCEFLMLCGSAAVAHVVMDLLMEILPALSPWPRALLPVVYPLWPPLLALIDGADLSVAAHAIRVLTTAVRSYGDELSSRVMGEAAGKMVASLERQSSRYTSTVLPDERRSRTSALGTRKGVGLGAIGAGGLNAMLLSATADLATVQLAEASAEACAPVHPGAGARAAGNSSIEARTTTAGSTGRSHELVVAAVGGLRALCAFPRAMRPHTLRVLRAAGPLLCSSQPETHQAAALALCRTLARLEADSVWLFCVGFLPSAERWGARPPVAKPRRDDKSLLVTALPPAEMVANAQKLLMDVQALDQARHSRVLGTWAEPHDDDRSSSECSSLFGLQLPERGT